MRRKIAAILAADVVGYSRLVAENEEDAIACLVSYRSIFEEHITRGYGRIFNTAGDAVLAEFSSSVEALRAAVDIQNSVHAQNELIAENRQMNFRIGITVGDVMEKDGDLLGDAVNIAARLEGIAEPGGICVSKAVYEQVGNKTSIGLRDGGKRKVKNISEAIHVFNVTLLDERISTNSVFRRRNTKRKSLIGFSVAGVVAITALTVWITQSWKSVLPPPSQPATADTANTRWRPNEMIYGQRFSLAF